MFRSRGTDAKKAKRKIRFARLKPKFRNVLYIFTVSLSAWLVATWALYTIDYLKRIGVGDSVVPLATLSTVVSAYLSLPARSNSSVGFGTTGLLTGVYTLLIFGFLFTMNLIVTDLISSGIEFPISLPDESFVMHFLLNVLYIVVGLFIFILYVGMTALLVLFFTFGTCILIPIALAWLFWPLEKKAKPPHAPRSGIG